MNTLRFIWKHRGGLGFLLLVGLVLGGVALLSRAQKAQAERDAAVVAPSVLAATRVEEKEPNDAIGQPQATKVSLGLDTWVSLSGKFDSDADKDRFRLGVGAGVTQGERWQRHIREVEIREWAVVDVRCGVAHGIPSV